MEATAFTACSSLRRLEKRRCRPPPPPVPCGNDPSPTTHTAQDAAHNKAPGFVPTKRVIQEGKGATGLVDGAAKDGCDILVHLVSNCCAARSPLAPAAARQALLRAASHLTYAWAAASVVRLLCNWWMTATDRSHRIRPRHRPLVADEKLMKRKTRIKTLTSIACSFPP